MFVKAPIRSRSSDRLVRVPREGWVDRSGSRHEAGITLSQAQPLRGTPTSCVYHSTRKLHYSSESKHTNDPGLESPDASLTSFVVLGGQFSLYLTIAIILAKWSLEHEV